MAEQEHSITIANRSFEDVTELKYLGTTLTDENCLHEEINPLKPKLVRTSKRTPHFTITKINWLTLFKFNPLKPKLV
jgi:hypothetical protein